MLDGFSTVFVAFFVAISPISIFPIFMSMVEGLEIAEARKLAVSGVVTGLALAVVIVFAGQPLFDLMGITVDDLRIGGGAILLVISIHDLAFSREDRKEREVQSDSPTSGSCRSAPLDDRVRDPVTGARPCRHSAGRHLGADARRRDLAGFPMGGAGFSSRASRAPSAR